MIMVCELIEALREWAVDICISDVPEPELVELLCKAADTIEQLSEKCRIDQITLYEQTRECSECGCDCWIEWNYCPNCGEDMRPTNEVRE